MLATGSMVRSNNQLSGGPDESAPRRCRAAGPHGAGSLRAVRLAAGAAARDGGPRPVPGVLRLRPGEPERGRPADHRPGGRGLPPDRDGADHRHRPHRHLGLRRLQPRAVAAPGRGGGERARPPGCPGHGHRDHRPGRGGPAGADRGRGARAAQPPGRDRDPAAASGRRPSRPRSPKHRHRRRSRLPKSPIASPSRSARSTATISARPTKTAAARPRTTWSAPS